MGRWRKGCVAALVVGLTSGLGCTLRYSQSLVGSMPTSSGQAVSSTATGLEFFRITLNEPTPAHVQVASLLSACKELRAVEVDYRSLDFLIVSIPRVTVKGTCVK